MGLGDLTKASEKLKELKRTRAGRQIRRKMKNKNEKLYSSKINIRENKIKWEEENKITIPKSDITSVLFFYSASSLIFEQGHSF